MATKNNNKINNNTRRPFTVIGASVLIVAIGLAVVWLKVLRGSEVPDSRLATFVAKRGPLTISVLESGTVKAREQIIIKNEVEGRTSIITLIPEGTRVKKGDLLVELDASTLEDAIIDQDILAQKAEALYVDANETLAVTENQAQSDIDVAKLTLKFAQQDLDQYVEGQYPKDVNELKAKIRLAEENLKRAEDVNEWSKRLYEEKYLSETEYLGDRLAVQQRRLERDVAISNLDLLENFTYHRQIEQLTSDVNQASMALERTLRKASADVIQAKADLRAKALEDQRQQEKLKKLQDQFAKTKIHAPADGMAIYATTARRGGWRDNRQPLDEGVEVFERQELIYLPTAASAMVEVDIHEASLEKVRVGLPAVVTVDALQGKKFFGTVARIAPLPDPQSMWMNPDLKVYNADVHLEGDEPSLRTGMSCKVEIIAEQYEDTVYVPVQTVLRVGGEPAVYVVKDGSVQERNVEIGLDNNRMIRIISGLNEGESVMLTPPLKSATIEPDIQVAGASSPTSAAADTLQSRINEKLEAANGTATGRPGMATDGFAGPQQQGRARPMEPGGGGSGRRQTGPEGFRGPSSEERQRMRQRFESMSDEERQKEMEKMKRRFENMSQEDRERMRQRFQGTGPSQEGGPRQGAGPREGAGPRRPGRSRPQPPERNQ